MIDYAKIDTSDKQTFESKVLEALMMLTGAVCFFGFVLVATA